MKILQINTVCGIGSTGRIATDLYKIIEEQGHDCKIAYGRGNTLEGIDSIKIGSNLDMYLHGINTRIFDKHGFGSKVATKIFIEEIKEYNPDIIHLHNIHGYYLNIEVLFNYLRDANKPVVWTLHDCWPLTGHCAYFDYVRCEKWKKECSNCQQKRAYPTSNIIDNSKINYNKKKELFTSVKNMTIVTPSRWLARLVKESFLGKYNVEVINNGIDLEIFKPTKSRFRESNDLKDKFIVLGVASVWEERKGLNYFIELSKKLNDDYKVVVIGVSEKQKKKLPENIIAITRTNDIKELAKIYTASDVFINPTLEDNFPTTNLEAIACGTPVITFDTGGSPECIEEQCGMVIKKDDISGLISSIYEIKRKGELSEYCIKKAKEFNKNNKFSEYLCKYSELNCIE